MKAVMLSIQPHWCDLIAAGEKTIEVRKTRPNLEVPFKVYIYCTQDKKDFVGTHCTVRRKEKTTMIRWLKYWLLCWLLDDICKKSVCEKSRGGGCLLDDPGMLYCRMGDVYCQARKVWKIDGKEAKF